MKPLQESKVRATQFVNFIVEWLMPACKLSAASKDRLHPTSRGSPLRLRLASITQLIADSFYCFDHCARSGFQAYRGGFSQQKMGDRKRKLDVDSGDYYQQPATQTNPHTGRPYSRKYYDILSKRKGNISVAVIF